MSVLSTHRRTHGRSCTLPSRVGTREWWGKKREKIERRKGKNRISTPLLYFSCCSCHRIHLACAHGHVGASRSDPCSGNRQQIVGLIAIWRRPCSALRGREMPLILHFPVPSLCKRVSLDVALRSDFEKRDKSLGTIFIATTTEKMFSHLFL